MSQAEEAKCATAGRWHERVQIVQRAASKREQLSTFAGRPVLGALLGLTGRCGVSTGRLRCLCMAGYRTRVL